MVCKASASIWRSVGPDGTLVKSGGRHGGEGSGASSGQRPSSKWLAERTLRAWRVQSALCARVVRMRRVVVVREKQC